MRRAIEAQRRWTVTDEQTIVREVDDAYRHLIETFNRRDAVELARWYDRPHSNLSGENGLSLVTSDEDHARWYSRVMASADEDGWIRTEIDHLQVWPLSGSLAQLVADVTRYTTDGSVLEQFRMSYTLRRRDGRWIVVTYTVVPKPFRGPGGPRADVANSG
jgi:hypothetical protein